jgi:hypothetical protein
VIEKHYFKLSRAKAHREGDGSGAFYFLFLNFFKSRLYIFEGTDAGLSSYQLACIFFNRHFISLFIIFSIDKFVEAADSIFVTYKMKMGFALTAFF